MGCSLCRCTSFLQGAYVLDTASHTQAGAAEDKSPSTLTKSKLARARAGEEKVTHPLPRHYPHPCPYPLMSC